jgi:hypothetical protein
MTSANILSLILRRLIRSAPSRGLPYDENSNHRDSTAADACTRAAIAATTTTKAARPMVPGGLDGERQLLRTGLRQGPVRYPQERLVSGRLA